MPNNNKNIILACVLSAMILVSWTWLYQKPKLEAEQKTTQTEQNNTASQPSQNQSPALETNNQNPPAPAQNIGEILPREEIIQSSKSQRVEINTPELHGSINLKGMLFDDLTLVKYRDTLDPNSKQVILLSPEGSADQYYVNFGYSSLSDKIKLPDNSKMDLPDHNSVWKANGNILTQNNPITFSWQSNQNIIFETKISVDEHYMFVVSQTIKNKSGKNLEGTMAANVERLMPQLAPSSYVSHEGPLGVFDGILHEKSYKKLQEGDKDNNNFKAQTGWFGITDKYWLVSVIPDKKSSFETNFSYKDNIYSVDSQSQKFTLLDGKEISFEHQMFAGAKRVSMLDEYSKKYNITLFDRAIDFGWYYFLTKPFFLILQFFNKIFGNYGLAILSITILIKLAMYPLANKSYGAIARIKKLQPKIDQIRTQFKDKKMQMNKEIMELYKREKVNPVSGCLPMLIQIPVFFSLYKVLYVTIDMRHAPFYGWIKDLSMPDPISVFNLFGLLPFEVHGMFAIGIWPILMGLTMFVQQKLNPKPSDPAQEKIMKLLPFILIFVFASFPAGLLIYWTWSNILSISQQWFITKKLSKK